MSSRMVTFTLDGRLYGVDVDAVQEVLRGQTRTRIPLAPGTLAGLINLRGQVLSAERIPFDGRDVNRVKVVDSTGRVKIYMDDPQQRGRRDDDRPTRREDNDND